MGARRLAAAVIAGNAVIAEGAHMRRHGRILRHRHAAFAGGQMLDRVKRETRDIAQRTGLATLIERARGMAGIGNDGD